MQYFNQQIINVTNDISPTIPNILEKIGFNVIIELLCNHYLIFHILSFSFSIVIFLIFNETQWIALPKGAQESFYTDNLMKNL